MVLVLCLSLTGCTNKSLLGSSYAEDDFSTMPRSMRRADSHDLPTACSNKARQIERNLGYE